MMRMMDRTALVILMVGVAFFPLLSCFAQQATAADEAREPEVVLEAVEGEGDIDPKAIETKLLKLTTMEEAFLKSLRTINLLNRYIAQENSKLEAAEDEEEKATIRKNIGEGRKRLQTLSNAMDVIFGIGRRRTYEYNNVTSTVYLRVGTVEEAFARAVQARDILRAAILNAQAELDKEQDEEKKQEQQQRIDLFTPQYQAVVASMQLIYGVTPQRNYQYEPRNSTLYLKISDSELEDLRAQLTKLQEERQKKAEEGQE